MKKLIYTFIFVSLFFLEQNQAQTVSNYVFGQSNVTYSPLSSPFSIFSSNWDDDEQELLFSSVASGFTFNFLGTNYDRIRVNSNGFVTFGATASTSFTYQPITSTTTFNGAAVAFGRDLIGLGTPVYFGVEGSAPNRTFVVEWRNALRNSSSTIVYGDNFNFQIRLLETSNQIKIHYGSCTASNIYVNAGQAGLRGASNTDFNNRSAGLNFADWNATNFGTLNNDAIAATNVLLPANGLMFTYGAGLPCSGVPTPGNTLVTVPSSNCDGISAVLKIQNPMTTSNIIYQWQSSSNNINFTNVVGATYPNYTVLNVAVQTYFRCMLTCNGNTGFSNSEVITPVNSITYTNLIVPYIESFENWQNGCSTLDSPGSSWKNSPATGNNSWRREDDLTSASWFSPGSYAYSPSSTLGSHSARFHSGNASYGAVGKLDFYFNGAAYQNVDFSFDYINFDGNDSIRVYLSTNGGSTFTKLGSGVGRKTVWSKINKNLVTNNSSTCVLRLEAFADYGNSDIGIDNLTLDLSCISKSGTSFASGNNTYTLSNLCEETSNGYTYYGNGTMNGFAVKWGANSANTKSNAVVKIISAASPTIYSGATSSTFIQKRIWDVTLNPSFPLTVPVDVRFYYSPSDTAQIRNLAAAFYPNVTQMKWFKSKTGTFDPANTTFNSGIGTINGSNVVELTPIYGTDPNGTSYVQFNGVTSFSGGTSAIASGAVLTPLPVRFLDFDAIALGQRNLIKWSSLEDGQTDYYLIEKSVDARNWTTLKNVKADNGRYEIFELNPNCISYYRIRGFDKDESEIISPTMSVLRKCNNFNIASISPNPAVNALEVVFESIEDSKVKFSIVDMLGKVIFVSSTDSVEGINRHNISVENLPNGSYYLNIIQGDNTKNVRFVKQ